MDSMPNLSIRAAEHRDCKANLGGTMKSAQEYWCHPPEESVDGVAVESGERGDLDGGEVGSDVPQESANLVLGKS